jgi:CRP/FNR family transcriptional regulator
LKNIHSPQGIIQRKRLKEVACNNCGMYKLCKLAGLERNDSSLDSIVKRRINISHAEYLYHAGDSFSGVFAVKSGLFKSIRYFEDGRQQITDFHLPGELIGLEAIEEGVYLQSVIAVENSQACDMNYAAMKNQTNELLVFQRNVIQALSRKVRLDQYQSLLTGAQNAEQRLAMFLISIFSRLQTHKMQTHNFRMPTRKDIANYLGLAMETVGRILKCFEGNQLIKSKGRHMKLCNYSEIQKHTGLLQYGCQFMP